MVWIPLLLGLLLSLPCLPSSAVAATASAGPQIPASWQRVLPAVVSIRAHVPSSSPSVLTLGPLRGGSGVIIDPAGYIVTVGYILVDADFIEVSLPDGRSLPATLVGLDLEQGFGLIQLRGGGPWPAAPLGDSSRVAVGDATGTIGMDDQNSVAITQGSVREIRGFAGYWEYALDRAFIVSPPNPAFGGSPLVNAAGEVIGVTSLQLGRPPSENLAIPIEDFLRVKNELMASGRVASRPPRPWLGLYTVQTDQGVLVAGTSPVGPSAEADFEQGDVILRLNGEKIENQGDFYRKLWRTEVGQEVRILVMRQSRFEVVTLRSINRYDLLAPRGK